MPIADKSSGVTSVVDGGVGCEHEDNGKNVVEDDEVFMEVDGKTSVLVQFVSNKKMVKEELGRVVALRTWTNEVSSLELQRLGQA
ncbi:hypothetical protein C1H46_017728 [Malus baccata]|uniref:Uncharacterized protein n=1 Tax=Malus baccata TaxID=106549 RepID=A0A540MD26_MALBA|nr:hypothetical protein C1H46_017728 [Malus baccata]